ncbi:MAG: dihydrodipicolinate synthase family protein [Planctomycetales bacterium]|nr:dihydrodipicolinate synthase family protein [Planctomycetales bacterium]
MEKHTRVIESLQRGIAIPAHPLALDCNRRLDERRQRALSRYYLAAGAGGLAVGVHTTQFAIHDPSVGLYQPVLELAAEEMDRAGATRNEPLVRVGGLCGNTTQAVREASILADLGYHAGLLNLGAMRGESEARLVEHCTAVAEVIPVFGFYLHADVGGLELPFSFWQRFVEIDRVIAIKVAAFNRYQTIDVVRALVEASRDDIALYTGNDDNIVVDLLTPYEFVRNSETVQRRFVGGLLGHWAVWTKAATELLSECQEAASHRACSADWLRRAIAVTDMNAAIFDAPHRFVGCIPGILEVLRRQGLLEGVWCLDDNELLSPGQADEISRVCAAYPELTDDAFVAEHRDSWLSG